MTMATSIKPWTAGWKMIPSLKKLITRIITCRGRNHFRQYLHQCQRGSKTCLSNCHLEQKKKSTKDSSFVTVSAWASGINYARKHLHSWWRKEDPRRRSPIGPCMTLIIKKWNHGKTLSSDSTLPLFATMSLSMTQPFRVFLFSILLSLSSVFIILLVWLPFWWFGIWMAKGKKQQVLDWYLVIV